MAVAICIPKSVDAKSSQAIKIVEERRCEASQRKGPLPLSRLADYLGGPGA